MFENIKSWSISTIFYMLVMFITYSVTYSVTCYITNHYKSSDVKPVEQKNLSDDVTQKISQIDQCYSYQRGSINQYLCVKEVLKQPAPKCEVKNDYGFIVPELKVRK